MSVVDCATDDIRDGNYGRVEERFSKTRKKLSKIKTKPTTKTVLINLKIPFSYII